MYRYGFNGKENDNEVKGSGNQQDYGLRMYDNRLGKFLSLDPLKVKFAWWSPYAFAGNTPIQAIDLDGGEILNYKTPFRLKEGKEGLTIAYSYSEYLFDKVDMLKTSTAISYGLSGIDKSIPFTIPLIPGGAEAQIYYTISSSEADYMDQFNLESPSYGPKEKRSKQMYNSGSITITMAGTFDVNNSTISFYHRFSLLPLLHS